MIGPSITLLDEHLGFIKTKFNKNLGEFLEDFSVRMGEITKQDKYGFVAELHSRTRLEDDTVTGHMLVIY